MPDPNEPTVVRVMREFREQLLAHEDDQLQRMANRWIKLEMGLQDQMNLLARELEDAKLKGSAITEQLLWDNRRYKALNLQVQKEINRYIDGYATPDIEDTQRLFGQLGITGAGDAIKAAYEQYTGVIRPSFHLLPVDAIEAYVGLAGDGSPLRELLKNAYPDAFDGITDALIAGTARGINPVQVAKEMADGMGMGLDRITLIARTEQLRVWRTASVEQYRASGVVKSFKRLAAKQERTCAACLALDGQLIPVGQELTDHPRGRCTTVPVVVGAPDVTWKSGEEWFNEQPPDVQKGIIGDKGWALWHDGKVPFKGFASFEENEIWGASPRTTTLTQLVKMAEGKVAPIVITTAPSPLPKVPSTGVVKVAGRAPAEILDTLGRATKNTVSSQEAEAIRRYTGSGAGEVNRWLRSMGASHIDVGTKRLMDNLIKAFEKMPVTDDVITLYRGTSFHTKENFLAFVDKLKVNMNYEDLGFMSTTTAESTALNFGGRSQLGCFFEIRVPKGSQVLQPFNSLYPNEKEVILNRGSKFKILDVVVNGSPQSGDLRVKIIMEMIQ